MTFWLKRSKYFHQICIVSRYVAGFDYLIGFIKNVLYTRLFRRFNIFIIGRSKNKLEFDVFFVLTVMIPSQHLKSIKSMLTHVR